MQNTEKEDDLFEEAVDSLSHFVEYLSQWGKGGEHYSIFSDTFLLVQLCKEKHTLEKIIPTLPTSGGNKNYSKKIKEVFLKNIPLFENVFNKSDRFFCAFHEAQGIASHLVGMIGSIRGLFDEYRIHEDETSLAEMRCEEVDFINLFSDVFCLIKECNAHGVAVLPKTSDNFLKVETAFRENFHVFEYTEDVLTDKAIAPPLKEEWWLLNKPDGFIKDIGYFCSPEVNDLLDHERIRAIDKHIVGCTACAAKAKEIKKFDTFIKVKMRPLWDELKKPRRNDCPCDNVLFAFAVDKKRLSKKVIAAVDRHVGTCSHCLKEIIDERAEFAQIEADSEPREVRYANMDWGFFKETGKIVVLGYSDKP